MTTTIPAPLLPAAALVDGSMPGFPQLMELAVAPWGGEGSPFVVLSAEDPCVRFVAVSPWVFFPDYRPVFPTELYAGLGVGESDAAVLVILTLGAGPGDTTANLLGPLVLNPSTGAMRQVVLSGSAWSPRTPITRPPVA